MVCAKRSQTPAANRVGARQSSEIIASIVWRVPTKAASQATASLAGTQLLCDGYEGCLTFMRACACRFLRLRLTSRLDHVSWRRAVCQNVNTYQDQPS